MRMRALSMLVAAGAAVAGASQAMTSPALLDPAAIAGAWTLSRAGGPSCRLTLKADEVDGRSLALDAGDCAKVAGITDLRSWRVSSDGIGLNGAEGTLMFLSKVSATEFRTMGQSSLSVGGTWTLTRG